ncbi:MAG: hypothetical protein AAF717_14945 [Bacteroidota bacterium]
MNRIRYILGIVILNGVLWVSCSKENDVEEIPDEAFLTFKTTPEGNSSVLYSKWIPSQFPVSSQNSSEIFDLPLIHNKFFDLEKDVILVYARRNNIFSLPVTLPLDVESYSVELLQGAKGTTTRLRVTALQLAPLQDIFFNPNFDAAFRVVIVPSEKLLPLKSKATTDFQKMTYEAFRTRFGLAE